MTSDTWLNLDKELVFCGVNNLRALEAITSELTVLSVFDGKEKILEFKWSGHLAMDELSYFTLSGMHFSEYLRFESDRPCIIKPKVQQDFDPSVSIIRVGTTI